MSSEVLTVISLFTLRLGALLLVTFVLGMLLSQWDSRRAEFFTR
jgi:hypothetical protein